MDLNVCSNWDHADHCCCAAIAETLKGLFGGLFQTDSLKRLMDTATGHFMDTSHSISICGVHSVGGTHLTCYLQLAVNHVYSDDSSGTRDSSRLHCCESDTTSTEHRHRFSGFYTGSTKDRPNARHHTATDK